MHHLSVRLARDAQGYPPFDSEELDVTPVGNGTWRIEAAPVFLYGVARGDILRAAAADDGSMWATEVVSTAGNWCARVIPLDGRDSQPIVDEFRALGCAARDTPYGLVVIEPPATVAVSAVKSALEAGRAARVWDFDLGVMPEGYES